MRLPKLKSIDELDHSKNGIFRNIFPFLSVFEQEFFEQSLDVLYRFVLLELWNVLQFDFLSFRYDFPLKNYEKLGNI